MKSQNNQEITYKSSHEGLSEIGQILAQAIIRLKSKEVSKNKHNQLDSNFYPSLHGASNNLNQNTI